MSAHTLANRNPASLDPERVRNALLHSKTYAQPFMVSEELRQSGFFITKMEEFISHSEKDEVDALHAQSASMTDDEKDEFWQNNYPVHWDEIFGIRIRSAFCTRLCSQVESTLSSVAGLVQTLSRSPLGVKNVKGSTLEQHRLYLETFGSFVGPSETLWKEIGYLFRIRNVHVHEQGYFLKFANDKEFVAFLNQLPNVRTRSDYVELQAGACPAFLSIAERFQTALFSEYQALRERLIAFEGS
jgi:hypothetical protein